MEDSQQPSFQGACSSQSTLSKNVKKHKHKSKVWDRVAWFSKKSRNKSQFNLYDISSDVPLSEDEVSPALMSDSLSKFRFLSGKSSYEENESCGNPSKLYQNSEVVEQSCLKPSIAKALFMQLEAVHLGSDTKSRYSWHKPKRHSKVFGSDMFSEYDDNDLTLHRAQSVPDEMPLRKKCHCISCCSCSPRERLSGECPVYKRRCTATASLDRGLDVFQSIRHCDLDVHDTINDDVKPSTLPKKSRDSEASKIHIDIQDLNNTKICESCFMLKHSEEDDKPNITQKRHLMNPVSLERCVCESKSKLPSISVEDSQNTLLLSDSCTSSIMPITKNDIETHFPAEDAAYSTHDIPCNSHGVMSCSPSKFKEKADELEDWFLTLNDDRKNAILLRLLKHCGVSQKHHLCDALETDSHPHCPPNCKDRISWLPHSLVLHIFSYLEPEFLGRASQVCKVWHNLANESSLWRKFCSNAKWRLSRTAEQKQIIQHMLPNGSINWKKVFAERNHLRNNWLNGRCTVRTFEGHMQGISCVQFDDTRIVSGSSDKTIKVWNIRTNSPWSVQTLVGHSGTVRCLHLEGNRLVSGSTDTTIKVWDLSTQHSWSSIACKVTMVGHSDTVRCLQVDDEKVISGSYDQKLKIWDVRTGRCWKTLRGHQGAVLCVRFDSSKIISGSCDKTIKVWNFDGSCVMTLQGHQDAVTCLQFDSQRIISGSLDCNLKFWNIHTGKCNNTIDWKASEGHTGVVRCLQADSWRIVSASDDRTLKVWSLETGKRLVTLRNHTDGVTCLQFNDSIIVSGSYDKTVKLWDFSSV